jgi:hypothetical protein
VYPKDAYATMQKERGDISIRIYIIYWREHAGSYAAIPDSELLEFAAEYKESFNTPLQALFKKMGTKLIVWDKQAEPEWRIGDLAFTKPVFFSGSLVVYQIVP